MAEPRRPDDPVEPPDDGTAPPAAMPSPSADDHAAGVPTDPIGRVVRAAGDVPSELRLFGSPGFFRLWLAMVVSSLGDWLGFVAITALAARVGGASPDAAVGLVLSARLVPGFFLGTVAGVLVDRWDRKRVMVVCDVGRAAVLATLPFVDTLPGLFLASLALEALTLLWAPAKEATVPNLVRPEFLANANSLGLVAAYGTFPVASAVFALFAKVAEWLRQYDALDVFQLNQQSVALYVDVMTFLFSALMISRITVPRVRHRTRPTGGDAQRGFGGSLAELREGFRFIRSTPVVRAVFLGIATGLIGAGMLVPLGPGFSENVVGGGPAGFGVLLTALGTGVAAGVVGVSLVQRRLPLERVFVVVVIGAGVCTILGASVSSLAPAVVFVALLGLCGGAVYVLGFTILQATVENELRGRIFATLNTLVRFCLLLALTIAPLLSGLLDGLSGALVDRRLEFGDVTVALPGVRLTLWFGGLIMATAGVLAALTLRGRSGVAGVDTGAVAGGSA